MEERRRYLIFSCVIPSKTLDDPKLKQLLASIRAQDFPQEQIETIVVTEGDSEHAKATGIRRAKGLICAMFCSDNYIVNPSLFRVVYNVFSSSNGILGVYDSIYLPKEEDNSLNKYFNLMGFNDPVPFYLRKCDRHPWYERNQDIAGTILEFKERIPTLGDNGFFWKREEIIKTDLGHFYIMDPAEELRLKGKSIYWRLGWGNIWHRTTNGNLLSFLKRRYRYARDLYSDRSDRRWKMVDGAKDKFRLAWFIFATLTIIQPLAISIRGFCKVRDYAWFWHWPVCLGFLITYGILAIRNLFKYGNFFQCKQVSLFQATGEQKLSLAVSKA